MFEPVFDISHFTYHLKYYYFNWLLLKAVKPLEVADLQKLASQLILNGALVIEMVINFFSESK